jgi:stage II sporulation protein D (peptidoglycan lytic transglycosylase)
MCRSGHNQYPLRARLFAFCVCASLVTACARPAPPIHSEPGKDQAAAIDIGEEDRRLQQAAASALGDREGAALVMDPQTGRLRAVVNPRLAFEQAFPPGSSLKVFTALTALRLGVIDAESRFQCPGRYAREGESIVCSHPKSNTPFNVSQALAYSCNYYFATLAERLSASAFNATLSTFGFGKRTGVNTTATESAGSIRGGDWRIRDALGEGDGLLATPIQMLAAYAALFNGGHLFRPRVAEPQGFVAEEQATVNIDDSQRRLLIAGCKGAIEYGTAAKAGLDTSSFSIFGKTGTSTDSNGFRRQGWFIAFAADREPTNSATRPAPESLRLAVLVFARRSHGSDCAEVAAKIFDEYARSENRGSRIADSAPQSSPPPSRDQKTIRVRLLREGRTDEIALEDYVLGVLSMEASTEDGLEALKTQAVVSRTFALKNIGRHASEGYDVCSNTHCQQYSSDVTRIRGRMREAVNQTAGEFLADDSGRPIEAFFHAACGGATASIESLWGVPAPSYLRGVRDDYCVGADGRQWADEIPAASLAKALSNDPRTDVGKRLEEVIVATRDASGRAETITLEGERRRQVRGWEFKMIVGRALGWNLLKSSRFEVSRKGSIFVFRGSGFGHGLGLCQQGAHVMSRRGAGYHQILDHYFPGTRVSRSEVAAGKPLKLEPRISRIPRISTNDPFVSIRFIREIRGLSSESAQQRVLSGEHFRISYRAGVQQAEMESVMRTLEAARGDLRNRLIRASVTLPATAVEVVFHESTQEFTRATGQPWFAAGATRGQRIQLQPISVLHRRRILTSTLRHEYAHAVIEAIGKGRAPRWLAEGLAIHFAGEGPLLKKYEGKSRLTTEEVESRLAHPASAAELRLLYAEAYSQVLDLIKQRGESSVWRLATQGESSRASSASMPLTEILQSGPSVRRAISIRSIALKARPITTQGNALGPQDRFDP